MSGADPPPPLPHPPSPVAPPRRRGPLFWIAVIGVPLLLCCGGVVVAALVAGADWIRIAAAPPAERQRLLSEKLASSAPGQVAAAETFLDDVEAGRLDEAWDGTAATFRGAMARKQFDDMADLVRRVMGPLRSRTLANVHVRSVAGGPSTTSLTLLGAFERGAGTISLEMEDEGGAWKVRAWRVDSPLFLEAMSRGASDDAGK